MNNEKSEKEAKVVSNISTSKSVKTTKKDKSIRKKIVSAGNSSFSSIKSTTFQYNFDESWKPLISSKREQMKKGKVIRKKGVVEIIGGSTGAGKTHLSIDHVNVGEIDLGYRIIPPFRPLFVIMTDPSPLDEIERNYSDRLWKDIYPVNCYVRSQETGRIDPIATLAEINKYLSGLRDLEDGAVVLEDFTIYCDMILYAYMKRSGGSKGKGISFDEFRRPEKKLSPTEYQYRTKTVDEILLSFQNDFTISFILVSNLKDEWENTGDSLYDAKKTGRKIEDIEKGSKRKADVVVRLWKDRVGNEILRKAIFTKSRFEGETVNVNKQTIVKPNANKVVKKLVELYLKQKGDN